MPGALDHLDEGGWLVLEIGTDLGAAVRSLCEDAGYVDIEVRPDFAGHDRIVVAQAGPVGPS